MSSNLNRKRRIELIFGTTLLVVALLAWLLRPTGDPAEDAENAASALTVEVTALRQETWPQTVRASGGLTAWQEVIVSPETGGLRIAEVVADVGARVKKGQVLARLADESLLADRRKQQAVVAQSRASLQQASSNLGRSKAVGASGALSEQQLEEYRISEATARASVASAQADLDNINLKLRQARIIAPDDGIVSSKTARLGAVVNVGEELYKLVRQGLIEWRPELDARQVSLIKTGQLADITLPTGEQVEGTVRLVSPVLSTDTGRATVYVRLPPGSAARAGMFATGVIKLDVQEARTLPQTAVILRDGRSYVYVIANDQTVKSQVVTTGRTLEGRIEVLSGVNAKQRIVSSGGAFLSEGARVTVSTSSDESTTGSAK